jgi:hypothetical protein
MRNLGYTSHNSVINLASLSIVVFVFFIKVFAFFFLTIVNRIMREGILKKKL